MHVYATKCPISNSRPKLKRWFEFRKKEFFLFDRRLLVHINSRFPWTKNNFIARVESLVNRFIGGTNPRQYNIILLYTRYFIDKFVSKWRSCEYTEKCLHDKNVYTTKMYTRQKSKWWKWIKSIQCLYEVVTWFIVIIYHMLSLMYFPTELRITLISQFNKKYQFICIIQVKEMCHIYM